jgi:uncharacterized membrane protein
LSLGTILLIILVIALLGGFSGLGGGRFYGTGYYGGGGLGLVLLIVLILVLLGKLLELHSASSCSARVFNSRACTTRASSTAGLITSGLGVFSWCRCAKRNTCVINIPEKQSSNYHKFFRS